MAATCGTKKDRGSAITNLVKSDTKGRSLYLCECVGKSKYGRYVPSGNIIECVIHLWICPV